MSNTNSHVGLEMKQKRKDQVHIGVKMAGRRLAFILYSQALYFLSRAATSENLFKSTYMISIAEKKERGLDEGDDQK